MKIGIISDTHDMRDGMNAALKVFQDEDVTYIVHCGDWTKPEHGSYFKQSAAAIGIPVSGVLGNNDREVESFLALNEPDFTLQEGVLRLEYGGQTFAVYHGHHQPTLKELLTEKVDVLCLGHSHKPRYDRIDHKIIINPGSTAFAIPRTGNWRASVAIYDTVVHEAAFVYF